MESEQGVTTLPLSDIDEQAKHNVCDYNDRTMSMGEWLDELWQYYLSIGVPFDEFWHGDYCRLKYYVDAYKAKLKYDNRIAWLHGLYVYDAFGTIMANSFGKGAKKKYLEEPIDFFKDEPKTEREQRYEQKREQEKIQRYFETLIANQNARKKREQEQQANSNDVSEVSKNGTTA